MGFFFDFHSHRREFFPDEKAIVSLFPDEIADLFRDGIFFSSGLHPKSIPSGDREAESLLESLSRRIREDRFVAVGECGLDRLASTPMGRQMELFERQIEFAGEVRKPLVVHCVRAHGELLAARKNAGDAGIPFCIHGFRGSAKLAGQLVGAGMTLSFGTASFADKGGVDTLLAIKDEMFFLESDGSPDGVEPAYLAVAEILGVDIEELKADISHWAASLFPILDRDAGNPAKTRVY
jgi:TatD DNase family protein